MEYYVYKLKFKTPVHIGNGTLSGSEAFIMADTLFSALCCESQSPEEIENLAERARERKLIFSDAMPFIGDEMAVTLQLCDNLMVPWPGRKRNR